MRPLFLTWLATGVVFFLVYFALNQGLIKTPVDPWLFWYSLLAVSTIPFGTLFYLHNFEVKRWSDSDYSPYASGDDQ